MNVVYPFGKTRGKSKDTYYLSLKRVFSKYERFKVMVKSFFFLPLFVYYKLTYLNF